MEYKNVNWRTFDDNAALGPKVSLLSNLYKHSVNIN